MYVEAKKVTELVYILEVVDRTEENRRAWKIELSSILQYLFVSIFLHLYLDYHYYYGQLYLYL